MVPPTARVATVNVARADPAGTVTLAGTMTVSPLVDKATTAPPDGAGPVSVAVPVTESPPTTLDALTEIDWMDGRAVTVSGADWLLLPLTDAVNVAVPAATAVIVNVALDDPAGMVTEVWTVATAGLLLDSAMLAPPVDAAVVRLTVPCAVSPATTLAPLIVTADTAVVAVADVGDADPPHCVAATAPAMMAASDTSALARWLIFTNTLPLWEIDYGDWSLV
jgi:hypothetical protein